MTETREIRPHQSSHDRGRQAELFAQRFLCAQGLSLIAHNFRWRRGEIDLIMREGDTIVFVEVRLRIDSRFGSAAETVTRDKQQRIIRTALAFLQRHPGFEQMPARFDVVSISDSSRKINWIKDAFRTER